nr:ribonuclease H-like domain-containing protein [Tanacetum cinerariifolium]
MGLRANANVEVRGNDLVLFRCLQVHCRGCVGEVAFGQEKELKVTVCYRVPTASEESFHCQKKREAIAEKIALLLMSRRNCQSKSDDSYAKLIIFLGTSSDATGKKKGRTVTLTAEDMQKRKNDVKARTTLLLYLPDEHQLRFSKYKTAQELWAAILKTFGGNEATKKTKKNLLKQQSDLDTMSLDDLYNHLKVYECEVQKKSEPNPQNMAFISLAKHSKGNEDVNTASVSTASTNVLTASANIRKKTEKKISIQGIDVAGFHKLKVECFNCHKMGHFARECRAPRSQDRGRRDNYIQENHALVADEEAPTEFALMANISAESKVFDNSLCSKDGLAQVESRLVEHKDREIKYCEKIKGLEFKTEPRQPLESKRLDNNKEGLGYSAAPHPPAQIYSSPKKDISWTGLPEFKDDIVTDYSRPAPTVESTPDDAQNKNTSVTETKALISTISPKSFIKFVKANNSPTKSKIEKAEKAKKYHVKYAEQYRKSTQKPNVRGNQRNWNNLKSHQLGPNFEMKKNACFNCGDFNHLAYDCRNRVKKGTSRSQNNTHKSFTPRPAVHKPYRPPIRPMRSNMN